MMGKAPDIYNLLTKEHSDVTNLARVTHVHFDRMGASETVEREGSCEGITDKLSPHFKVRTQVVSHYVLNEVSKT